MYSYTWDTETGGLLLNSSPLHFSKEPRPVYSRELDLLGFDQYWNYERNDSAPFMWAEANNYIYRGRHVATVKGGNLREKPQIVIIENPEEDNKPLRQVDLKLMSQKNAYLLEALTQQTIKQIYNSFIKYKKRGVDVFYVAFSGGKDSIVTLDLVQKALPHSDFKVLFGDTGMEFPDTYETVNYIEASCEEMGIDFIRSKSYYTPKYTWSQFGPPATVNRWCCSVHKTAPQILALRESTGIQDFTGMAFIGVRASESVSRSDYDYISLGEKHKGQWSFNPILEWNSAELFTYIFSENLYINKAYIKGNRRAGCLVCPRASERNEYIARICYQEKFNELIGFIRERYREHFSSKSKLEEFISNGGWKARKNGRDLDVKISYNETITDGNIIISVDQPTSDWKEWIKTIGELQNELSPFQILHRGEIYIFEVEQSENNLEVKIDSKIAKKAPEFIKLFKNVFRKAASCIRCRVCEADCPHGALHLGNDMFYIDEKCKHCSLCHKVEKGCLVYKSLEQPKGMTMNTKSLNCYSHHAPKMSWFEQFFKYKSEFATKHSLGKNMFDFFKRFLKDAELMNNNKIDQLVGVIDSLGLASDSAWALMMSNLVYTPQFNWLVKRIEFNEIVSKEYTLNQLVEDGAKESWVSDIWSSFTRISELPFGQVGFGTMQKEKNKATSIIRKAWATPDARVILYALYKFAEACGGYYQFTLSRLYDRNIDSDGVTPYQIFGIEENEMRQILVGLQANYGDFISTTFTHDLDNVNLKEDKTSRDVLSLF